MSHRINIKDAKQKFEHEKQVQEKLKQGDYQSTRFERRKQKRIQHELSWFQYIKARGGIKEKKEKKKDGIPYKQNEETKIIPEQGKEVQQSVL